MLALTNLSAATNSSSVFGGCQRQRPGYEAIVTLTLQSARLLLYRIPHRHAVRTTKAHLSRAITSSDGKLA